MFHFTQKQNPDRSVK